MKKAFTKALGLLLSASLLTACGAATEAPKATTAAAPEAKQETVSEEKVSEAEPEITLTLSHQMAESHSINTTAKHFADLVKEKSGGTIAVDVFPSATLGTETENLQALSNGTLDMAIIAAEFYANYVDEAGILCLPYMYDSYDDCYEKLNSEAGDKIKEMILEKTNVRPLDWYVLAFRQIFTVDREINSVDDMAGLIIRIPDSTTYKTTFSQLGAAPTAVAWGETYTALDTGVVAAVENIPESIMSASMQEVCKYVNVTNHLIAPTTISISNQVFEKLTEEQQNILTEAAAEACEYGKNMTAENSDANFASLENAGLTVVETDVESMKNAIKYEDYACAQSEEGKEILSMLGK